MNSYIKKQTITLTYGEIKIKMKDDLHGVPKNLSKDHVWTTL